MHYLAPGCTKTYDRQYSLNHERRQLLEQREENQELVRFAEGIATRVPLAFNPGNPS